MVRPALEHAPPSLWAEAYNWACYIKNILRLSVPYGITPYEALYIAKPSTSHLRPFYAKCYAHIDKKERPSGSKLEPGSIEERLAGYTDCGKIFYIYFPLNYKVDTVRQVRFELSSYTSVDVHPPPLSSDLADNHELSSKNCLLQHHHLQYKLQHHPHDRHYLVVTLERQSNHDIHHSLKSHLLPPIFKISSKCLTTN